MMRRFGERVRPDERYTLRPGAYAALIHGQDILLTYQAGIHHEFQLPAGGIDPGESAVQALYREVYEETGWRLDRPRQTDAYRRFASIPHHAPSAAKTAHRATREGVAEAFTDPDLRESVEIEFALI